MKNKKILYIISIIVLIIDQVSKLIVRNTLNLYQEIKLIPKVLSLYYVKNTGAAFSILENNNILLIIISLCCIGFLIKFIHDEKLDKISIILFGILLGGILGNLCDRVFFGYVIDFISVFIFKYSFPVFNLADICICCSTIGIVFTLLEKNKKI